MDIQSAKIAFKKSIPILCSYFFVAIGYGIMMEEAGYKWYVSMFTSFSVYTGAFQFVLVSFLSSAASILTIAFTAFLMNSRQIFYGITFHDEFMRFDRKKLYMILTLTDETYAVNLTLEGMEEDRKHKVMYGVAALSKTYWIAGSVVGGLVGQLIPYDMQGIDFCMTALFVIIFVDQWENTKDHVPALVGLAVGFAAMLLLNKSALMLPSLLVVSGILLLLGRKKEVAV